MRLRLTALAMLLAAVATLPAHADELTIFTFNTTVTPNIDGTLDGAGLFGPVGANLVGDAATIVYTLDLNLGMPNPDPSFQTSVATFPTFNLSLLDVAASITINGRTYSSELPPNNVGESNFRENSANGMPTQLEINVLTGVTTCTDLANNGCLPIAGYNPLVSFQEFYNLPPYGASFEYVQPSTNPLSPSLITTIVSLADTAPVVTTVNVTPEPQPLILLGTGALAIAGTQRRRWRHIKP